MISHGQLRERFFIVGIIRLFTIGRRKRRSWGIVIDHLSEYFSIYSAFSGGFELIINGNYLNNIQNPLMKFVSNNSDYEFSSVSFTRIDFSIGSFIFICLIKICTEITRTQMICHSPVLSKALEFHLPMNFHIHFLMDNLQIIPDENILTIVNDPIYHPFVDFIQEINSTNIIHFEVKQRFWITQLR